MKNYRYQKKIFWGVECTFCCGTKLLLIAKHQYKQEKRQIQEIRKRCEVLVLCAYLSPDSRKSLQILFNNASRLHLRRGQSYHDFRQLQLLPSLAIQHIFGVVALIAFVYIYMKTIFRHHYMSWTFIVRLSYPFVCKLCQYVEEVLYGGSEARYCNAL